MERQTFEQHIGKPFAAAAGRDKTVTLELIQVQAREKQFEGGREEPFVLIFKGSEHLPDNTYDMTLSDGTTASIFISAHKKDEEGSIHYDAVFT